MRAFKILAGLVLATAILTAIILAAGIMANHSRTALLDAASERIGRLVGRHVPRLDPVKNAPKRLAARLAAHGLAAGQPVFVRIFKEESELEVWLQSADGYRLLHTYPICKWSGRLGPKLKEGDRQSPEGFYEVSRRQLNPHSRHHLAFNIGFPNAYDQWHGRTGTYLMVHGGCTSIGCYAVGDANVDEVYSLVAAAMKAGQSSVPVHIFPFRMTSQRLAREHDNQWFDYWANLKEGHDAFEATGSPPKVSHCAGEYRFNQSGGDGCALIAAW